MAIPTLYRGVEYRSRLEARWASFFHRLGWDFIYEPFDGHGYIPDFLIQGENPLLVEVKPATNIDQYMLATKKMEDGVDGLWSGRLLVVGASPLPYIGSPGGERAGRGYGVSFYAGIIRSEWYDDWERAVWGSGGGGIGLCEEYGSFVHSPSGWYDGNHGDGRNPRPRIEAAWASATNDVKWRAKEPRR